MHEALNQRIDVMSGERELHLIWGKNAFILAAEHVPAQMQAVLLS